MGGDYAPEEVVAGAVKWLQGNDSHIILVGKEPLLRQELQQYKYDTDRLSLQNAEQVIEMDESPATALRKKKDSSIVVATGLVKNGLADALISCGNTGAQMAAALFILGRMEGIDRPSIVAPLPNQRGGYTMLIDVGANVDCKPQQLLQFALLGSVYASISLGVDQPTVALLNNGEEETKGNNASVEAYSLLKNSKLNFVGNIEGRELLAGDADVIVCDGFVGNILLKAVEGIIVHLGKMIHKETGAIPNCFTQLDYTKVGGAPLLGVNGISIVCHGSSRRETVYNGLRVAAECVLSDIVTKQAESMNALAGADNDQSEN
jgi:glycerol-3-phosphate acyltransferase PlsX